METVAKIRRAYFVQKNPIKAICRELGLSRKVVRKVIRSNETEFHYNRESWSEPKIAPWLSPVSTNGTDLRLRFKEGWGFVVVTKERR